MVTKTKEPVLIYSDQVPCPNCQGFKIQLVYVNSWDNDITRLDLVCSDCGMLLNIQLGGGVKPIPKPTEKNNQRSYLG